ncbi:MAG: hypothetical protein EHM84_08820 [Lysobacterales bacterium]|jgi:glutamyl-tRNA reductase|nr:MAG: hypothetical protein EHM84_08820 [Xanthomonadales bacterium]
MGTMNFSIPDDVKEAFNKAFEGENKSAIVTRLMIQAIEDAERKRRSRNLVERLRAIREQGEPVKAEEIARARQELRE